MTNENLKVTRTLGFELEGFAYDADRLDVSYSDVGYDGSLCYGRGDAVEVRTKPIRNLNLLEEIYSDLRDEDFNVNPTCGLHIHVDTSDFTIKDKAKLLRFGAGIELLMYSLVEPHRYYGHNMFNDDDDDERERRENGYCIKIHKSWRKIFRDSFISQPIPFNDFTCLNELGDYITHNGQSSSRCWNGKYQWLNANVNNYPTVEFRIFNATEDFNLVQKYGMLAYHIVETVKNSTVKQLTFIINSIYESTSIEEMYNKLFDAIGLEGEFRLGTQNDELADYIHNKYCLPNIAVITENTAV